MTDKPFTKFYHDLQRCKALTFPQRHIIAMAQAYSGNGMALYASQKRIADDIGAALDTVHKAIKGLKEMPFMVIESQGNKKPLIIKVDEAALDEYLQKISVSHTEKIGKQHTAKIGSIRLSTNKTKDKTKEITTGQKSQAISADVEPTSSDEPACLEQETEQPVAIEGELMSRDEPVSKPKRLSQHERMMERLNKARGNLDPLGSDLPADEYPFCKAAIKIMNSLRRDEGLTALYTARMKREQWDRCEAALSAGFAHNANGGHLEQHIFDMATGPLSTLPMITLNHLCSTWADGDDIAGISSPADLWGDHYGLDNAGYAY